MNLDAEKFLMNIFLNSVNYQIWLPDQIDELCNRCGVAEKQIYATLYKWSNKGYIDYGTSVRGAWLTDLGIEKFNEVISNYVPK